MSELLDTARRRQDLLKHLIRQLHDGQPVGTLRAQLIQTLGQVPYHDVVAVEQELIREGLPTEEVLKLCDLHSAVLHGAVDTTAAPSVPDGHPVHTFHLENEALRWEIVEATRLIGELAGLAPGTDPTELLDAIRGRVNNLMDVDKHYARKEHLVFPFLEKAGITGPPVVMWGKHDETRALLAGAVSALDAAVGTPANEALVAVRLCVEPALRAIGDMIGKEEQILLPMCLETIDERGWYDIKRQSLEYGYCLVDPTDAWEPAERVSAPADENTEPGRVQLPSGSLVPVELQAILNTIPFDLTFVDKDDTVRYFTQGRERIFSRSRAILGRKVQYCHPPSSVKIVEQILRDFRSGVQTHAAFWITMKGRFLSIEYFALHDPAGAYLGCLEVSQDLTDKRALSGEQRLLNYVVPNASHTP